MSAITLHKFTVHLNTPETLVDPELVDKYEEHEIIVIHQDMLAGEREGKKRGLVGAEFGLHISDMWAWAALRRTGRYKGTLDQFLNQDVAGVKKSGEVDVDPTPEEAGTTSPSSSPESSSAPPSPTGSTKPTTP